MKSSRELPWFMVLWSHSTQILGGGDTVHRDENLYLQDVGALSCPMIVKYLLRMNDKARETCVKLFLETGSRPVNCGVCMEMCFG